MKKSILISILATGVVGFAAWQYDLGKQDGAGETRPVALPQVSPQQTEPETKSAQPITKTEFDNKPGNVLDELTVGALGTHPVAGLPPTINRTLKVV